MSKRSRSEKRARKAFMAPRNWHAVSAWMRLGGPMKDRRAPRGGAHNEKRELLAELDQEYYHGDGPSPEVPDSEYEKLERQIQVEMAADDEETWCDELEIEKD